MSAVVVQKSPGPDFSGEINHTAHTSFGRAGLTTPSEKVTEKLRERQTAGLSSYTPEGYPFFPFILHSLPPSACLSSSSGLSSPSASHPRF